jgi:tetratricopeptide (TPR) repeat protein
MRNGRFVTGLFALSILMGVNMSQSQELPDFNELWDFNDPAATEVKFRELLPQAESSGDTSYHLQLLTQIARTLGLQMKFEEAHELLDGVEVKLTDDLPVVRIRYLLERGRVFNSSGKPEASKNLFLEAWELASEVGEDFYAVDAAHMMGIVEAPERQLDWNLKAMMAAESSKVERARKWLGSLYNNIGWTYHELGNYEKALDLFTRGYEWRKEQGQALETRIAKWTIARALRSLERLDEALAMQQELLEEWKEAGEEDGYVYEEIGECLLALGKKEESKPHFRRAHELLSEDPWLAKNEAERLERLKELGTD